MRGASGRLFHIATVRKSEIFSHSDLRGALARPPAPFFPLAARNPVGTERFRAAHARTLTVYVNLNVCRRYVVATSGQIIVRHNVLISTKLFPRLVLVHGRGVLRSTHVLELRVPARFHDLGANWLLGDTFSHESGTTPHVDH